MTQPNQFSQVHSASFDGLQHGQGIKYLPFETAQSGSLKVMLLHGHLDIWVKEAKCLPNMDMFHKTLNDIFGCLLMRKSSRLTSDPYVNVSVASSIIARTFVLTNDENPVWMQHFFVPVAHTAAEVHFVVKDDDVVGAQIIGAVGIPVQQLYSGDLIEGVFPIMKACDQNWETGASVGLGSTYSGVPRTYFPLRRGNRVTLYQDAHVEDGMLPNFGLEDGMHYVHGQCWHDVFDAISGATKMVYLTGWSVTHVIELVRGGGDHASGVPLGTLLKNKAEEGVTKSVIVDADAGNYKRKVIAFVGGLDLCKGRYDTPEHSLFRTLQTLHKDDYHNPNLAVCNYPFLIFSYSFSI
ncbi:Phospholipase D gamma 1 [Bienertia sinuspersici]